ALARPRARDLCRESGAAPRMTTPLLLDVDTGVDDAIALLLAVARPDVELVGAGAVEVAMGSEAPLVEPLRTATSNGPKGLGHADLPPARASVSHRFG